MFKTVIEYPIPDSPDNRNSREFTHTLGQAFPSKRATKGISDSAIPYMPLKLFYSYAHEDEEYRRRLDSHLRLLQRQGLIDAWHDRRIGALLNGNSR